MQKLIKVFWVTKNSFESMRAELSSEHENNTIEGSSHLFCLVRKSSSENAAL